jgi:alpha-1,3-mannosylglycoprotein beta-1,4-N-acetylglucosaminyltransferase A/B
LYFVAGKFDSVGIATGVPDESIGKIQALRLHVHSESDNWAILSEVSEKRPRFSRLDFN